MDIDIAGAESRVELKSLLFDHVEYARDLDQQYDGVLSSEFTIEIKGDEAITPEDCEGERSVRVTLELFGNEDKDGPIYIAVRLVGVFYISAASSDQFAHLLNYNTVAMMMPYIRSQITLLTSQPGLTPLILPVVDVNKLVNSQAAANAKQE